MKFLLAALLAPYLPILGILFGGSTCSLVLGFFGREHRDANSLRLSRELIEYGAGNKVFLIIALLPFPVIAVLWQRILPAPFALPGISWIVPFVALLSGCALLSAYASAVRRATDPTSAIGFRTGIAGLLAVALGSFLFFLLLGAPFNPEKLPLIRDNPVFLLSWKFLTGFLLFLALSFGLTGGIVLRFRARPPAEKEDPGPVYREYARSVGTSLSLAPALAIPAIVVLDLLSVPETGLSMEVFAAAIAVLLLALAAARILFLPPEKTFSWGGTGVPLLYVLMFLAALSGERAAVANAFLGRPVPPKPELSEKAAEAAKPAASEPVIDQGRAVFQQACRSCHLIDRRIVGPPLKDVLSKYRGNLENLKRYIREPAKVNPQYPLMPALGIPEEEVDAVARYLLASVGMEQPPEKPATPMPAEEKGKAVFETVCASCHRFDTRLVGPPFKDVVPKYAGNVEWLKRFIRDPVKTSAGYPAMPKLGLKEEEIDAVARYLLASVGIEKPPETPAAAMPAAETGKAVLDRVCGACHRVDTRHVGPPFKEVVPKYRGNAEGLKRFIRDPVKVDPAYPAMPKHALSEEEIDAVARYLLATVGKGG